MIRHDAEGRAVIAYVQLEEGCADDPAVMRGTQCVYVITETDPIT